MSIKKLLIVVILALGAFLLTKFALASEISPNRQETLTIRSLSEIEKLKLFLYEQTGYDYAKFNKINKLVVCESSWRVDVRGDGGNALGLMQYWEQTFNEFAEEYKKEIGLQLYRENPYDQILLTIWALDNGKDYHWTCLR